MLKTSLKHLLWIALILLLSAPLAFIVTFLLTPLWSWIETTYKIESIGHSGPADWCFEVIYGLLVVTSVAIYGLARRHMYSTK